MESEDQDEEYKRLGGRIDEMLEERVERMVVDRLQRIMCEEIGIVEEDQQGEIEKIIMNRWMNSLEIKDRMIEQLVGECMMMKEKIDEMEIERRKGVIAGQLADKKIGRLGEELAKANEEIQRMKIVGMEKVRKIVELQGQIVLYQTKEQIMIEQNSRLKIVNEELKEYLCMKQLEGKSMYEENQQLMKELKEIEQQLQQQLSCWEVRKIVLPMLAYSMIDQWKECMNGMRLRKELVEESEKIMKKIVEIDRQLHTEYQIPTQMQQTILYNNSVNTQQQQINISQCLQNITKIINSKQQSAIHLCEHINELKSQLQTTLSQLQETKQQIVDIRQQSMSIIIKLQQQKRQIQSTIDQQHSQIDEKMMKINQLQTKQIMRKKQMQKLLQNNIIIEKQCIEKQAECIVLKQLMKQYQKNIDGIMENIDQNGNQNKSKIQLNQFSRLCLSGVEHSIEFIQQNEIEQLRKENQSNIVQLYQKTKKIAQLSQQIEQLNTHLTTSTIQPQLQQQLIRQPLTPNNLNRQDTPHGLTMLNQLLNYMMNYLKGYNGRNIRNGSWLEDEIMKRGEEYAQRIMGKSNMRAKMENWENVRRVVSNDRKCREFVKDFEVVVGYYFEKIQEGRKKTIGKNCNSRGYEDN